MIDVGNEQIVTFAEAARSLPGRPNITTLWRWRNRGVRGVKLEVACVGGRTYTSREALARFLERVTAAKNGEPIPSRSNRQREREQHAATLKLQAAGIMD
jgi:hypothetical protein